MNINVMWLKEVMEIMWKVYKKDQNNKKHDFSTKLSDVIVV